MNTNSLPRIAFAPAFEKPAPRSATSPMGLFERLAAWADRHPQHHRLGNWTAVGITVPSSPASAPSACRRAEWHEDIHRRA